MSGTKILYISSESKVFKMPQPKDSKYKEIKELSGQVVLKVMLYYETKNRKPYKLLIIEFDRIELDSQGAYKLTDEEIDKRLNNTFNFIFTTPEELANRDLPFVLPIAPCIPSTKEKKALYDYLNINFPTLAKDVPIITERTIHKFKKIHREKIDMIKEAKFLRGQKSE